MSGESILDGVSEVDVAILSEGRKRYLHSFPDNRDAHTRAEVVEALPKAGRPCDEQIKVRTRTVDADDEVAPIVWDRTRRQLGWRNAGQRSELPGAHD